MNEAEVIGVRTCPECGRPMQPHSRLTAACCTECDVILLPAHLEELWQEMLELREQPGFWDAVNLLDPALRESYVGLLHMRRIWLADGRQAQARAAVAAVRRAMTRPSRQRES